MKGRGEVAETPLDENVKPRIREILKSMQVEISKIEKSLRTK